MVAQETGPDSVLLGQPVLFLCALAAIVLFFIPRSIADPDIWWHLRNAETLVSTHRFIGADPYSYTARGAPWLNHEWMGELPFYFGWRVGKERGVYLITALAIELLILDIGWLAYRMSRSALASFAASVTAAVLCTVSYGPRTILFGWLCLVTELLILDASETCPQLIWILPALFGVWANTHGSWMIGFVLWSCYLLTETRPLSRGALSCAGIGRGHLRSSASAYALSFTALFLNPYGWRLVAYPFNLAFRQRLNIANVEEWRSLDLHSPRGIIVLACLAVMALCQLSRAVPWRPRDVAFLFVGTYAALTYSRFLVLFSILVLPLLARSVGNLTTRSGPTRRASPLLRAAILFFILCLIIGRWRASDERVRVAQTSYPETGLTFLREHPPHGRLLNEYRWGGYMIWNARDSPVFIDSRVDLYEYNGTFKDYLDIIRIRDTLSLLDKYEIRYVLFERETPLVYLLEHTPGWKVDFAEGDTILLERIDSNLPKLIQ